jgi:uncharacterized Zn finger protein
VTRENVDTKGRRYLCEGRIFLKEVSRGLVWARVRGSDEVYVVKGDRFGWSCSCAARGKCSHLVAVQLVTLRPKKRAS